MKAKGHVPIRRCIGCGMRHSKREMIRLVRDRSGSIGTDLRNLQGRGFYLCRELTCLDLALRKRRGGGFPERWDLEMLRPQIFKGKEKQEEVEWQR